MIQAVKKSMQGTFSWFKGEQESISFVKSQKNGRLTLLFLVSLRTLPGLPEGIRIGESYIKPEALSWIISWRRQEWFVVYSIQKQWQKSHKKGFPPIPHLQVEALKGSFLELIVIEVQIPPFPKNMGEAGMTIRCENPMGLIDGLVEGFLDWNTNHCPKSKHSRQLLGVRWCGR